GATAELIVDAAGFVAFGTQNVQAAGLDHLVVTLLPLGLDGLDLLRRGVFQLIDFRFPVAAQPDVATAAGHIGGNGNGSRPARLGDDLGFLLVEFGVEHPVFDAGRLQAAGDFLGGFDGGNAHQHRRVLLLRLANVLDNGRVLLVHGEVDQIVQ